VIIHLIASPRNVSTALMYSLGQHTLIHPIDEPFYAAYLAQSGANHPDRELILNNLPHDRSEVFDRIRALESKHSAIFIKNMAHHLVEDDFRQMDQWKHVFLIRHPRLHIHSFSQVITNPNLEALGTTTQRQWYDILRQRNRVAHIIDANHLLKDPKAELRRLCHNMGIGFQSSMLRWPEGPKSFDGCWASHWYQSAWKTTRFGPPRDPLSVELPGHLQPLYKACMIDYQYLYNQIKP